MKKLALTIAIVLGISFATYAQSGLFGYGEAPEEKSSEAYDIAWYSFYQNGEVDNGLFGHLRELDLPNLPNHGAEDNMDAPLAGGALLLIGFGAAYALKKRMNN